MITALITLVFFWCVYIWACNQLYHSANPGRRSEPRPRKAPAPPLPWGQWFPATLLGVIALAIYIAYSASQGSIFGVVLWSCLLVIIVARFVLKVAVDRQANTAAVQTSPPHRAPAGR